METATKPKQNASAKSMTTTQKVNRLFALEEIKVKDLEDFSQLERDYLAETATEKLERLTGEERDNFLTKIAPIVPASTKNQLWEYNNMVISQAISKFICEHGYMPPKTFIATQTGLSRQTVVKHFKEYKMHPEHAAAVEQYKFMSEKVLASVFKSAVNGDARSARLYFEMVGAIDKQQPNTSNTVVNEQNNYIQINNTILSQENLRQLSTEQLNQIESIITNREYR